MELIVVSNNPVYCGTAFVAPTNSNDVANGESINLGKIGAVNIYPNPVSEVLNIKWNTATDTDLTIELLTVTGQRLLTKTVQGNDFSAEMNVEDVQAGVYLLRVKMSDGEEEVFRVVKR